MTIGAALERITKLRAVLKQTDWGEVQAALSRVGAPSQIVGDRTLPGHFNALESLFKKIDNWEKRQGR